MNRPTAVLPPGDAAARAQPADPSARGAPGASEAQSSLGTGAALSGDAPRDSQGWTAIGSGVEPLGSPDNGQWLADLHQRLKDAAQKCYPPSARRLRLQGEADLVFALDERGEARNVHLARSSGSSILDRAATECVLRGALPAPGRPGQYGPVTIKFTEKR
jgi:protein TonB